MAIEEKASSIRPIKGFVAAKWSSRGTIETLGYMGSNGYHDVIFSCSC
jgi:hypothetical protein